MCAQRSKTLRPSADNLISVTDLDLVLKHFDTPDEVRVFTKGRFELVKIAGITIGRASYEPGWKWSIHVGPPTGQRRCTVEHLGIVLQGVATVAFDDGRVIELRPGGLFHVGATPHDSWVVGDQPYVSIHLLNSEHYAKPHRS
jgi:hypothetical protein